MNSGALRIGVLAPEFPPALGGMHTLAWGLARGLAGQDEVVVYTVSQDRPHDAADFRVEPSLSGVLARDARLLAGQAANVDVWLALNGGMIPLARQADKPMFFYLHGNDFLNPWIGYGSWWIEWMRRPYVARVRHALRRRALRSGARHPRHFFANSKRTAELASECLGLRHDSITIAPPGVDDRFFQSHEPAGHGPLRLLTVTRLTKYTKRKNVDGVIRAISLLALDVPIRYTVVGDGDDLPRLRQLARDLGMEHAIDFRGAVSGDALLACYRSSDLFVLASRATDTDVEGFGIVYLEASAAGVPVICSADGGSIDAVTPGANGLIAPSSSPESIAETIRAFAATREQYSADAVRAVAERYRWRHTVDRIRSRIRLDVAQQPRPAHHSVVMELRDTSLGSRIEG